MLNVYENGLTGGAGGALEALATALRDGACGALRQLVVRRDRGDIGEDELAAFAAEFPRLRVT